MEKKLTENCGIVKHMLEESLSAKIQYVSSEWAIFQFMGIKLTSRLHLTGPKLSK